MEPTGRGAVTDVPGLTWGLGNSRMRTQRDCQVDERQGYHTMIQIQAPTELNAGLEYHYSYNPISNSTYLSKLVWLGDPSLPLKLDRRIWEYCQEIIPANWELVSDDGIDVYVVVCRNDAGYWYAYHRFLADWDRLVLSPWLWVKRRMILTAAIWRDDLIPGIRST
jgi:hypothetical protein